MKPSEPRPLFAAVVAALVVFAPVEARATSSSGPPADRAGEPAAVEVAAPQPAKPWYERITVSGLAFGDAYMVAEHHDPELVDRSGFWLRRAYLTFDVEIADSWSARLRFEGNSPGEFESEGKIEPFVKDAWLGWRGEQVELLAGISPSPTFDLLEAFWGYRAVEKTPVDLYRMGSSRDFGLAAKGTFAAGRLLYHAMLGNGAGESSETNDGKKAMLALAFRPSEALVAELYVDTEDRPESTDRTTWQGFVGLRGARSRLGLQYVHQERELDGERGGSLAVGSVFGVVELAPRASLLLRFDRSFDGNPEAGEIPYYRFAEDVAFDLLLLGFDWTLAGEIHLVPNLSWVTYRETAGRPAPDDDLTAKLTLSFGF